ncbi:MAG TPA: DedA family protein [Nitrosopumilaceae archaeon]|nr:DedA family protein [Nitrosopumilaceae archaeon]
MSIETFVQWVISLVSDYLYLGIFSASLLETIFPPIPSEVIFPLAGYIVSKNNMSFFHVIGLGITGAAGSTTGAFVTYLLALKIGREGLARYLKYLRITDEHMKKVDRWFAHHGEKVVLFGRMVPGIRELVSIPAGFLKMKVLKFLIFTFVGSCVWGISLSLAGYYFGIASVHFFG